MKLFKNHTNQSVKKLVLFGFSSLVAATTIFGQIAFDEYGHSVGMGPGFIGADPSGGIAGVSVLMYALPFGVLPGDVLLTEEPGANQSQFSDVIRFWNPTFNPNQSLIIFYSEQPENPLEIPPPADIGLPGQLLPVVAGPFLEIGTDLFNFYDYTAGPGMPGFAFPGVPTTYHIVSDGLVPEPGVGALAALGGGLLFALKRRFPIHPEK